MPPSARLAFPVGGCGGRERFILAAQGGGRHKPEDEDQGEVLVGQARAGYYGDGSLAFRCHKLNCFPLQLPGGANRPALRRPASPGTSPVQNARFDGAVKRSPVGPDLNSIIAVLNHSIGIQCIPLMVETKIHETETGRGAAKHELFASRGTSIVPQ